MKKLLITLALALALTTTAFAKNKVSWQKNPDKSVDFTLPTNNVTIGFDKWNLASDGWYVYNLATYTLNGLTFNNIEVKIPKNIYASLNRGDAIFGYVTGSIANGVFTVTLGLKGYSTTNKVFTYSFAELEKFWGLTTGGNFVFANGIVQHFAVLNADVITYAAVAGYNFTNTVWALFPNGDQYWGVINTLAGFDKKLALVVFNAWTRDWTTEAKGYYTTMFGAIGYDAFAQNLAALKGAYVLSKDGNTFLKKGTSIWYKTSTKGWTVLNNIDSGTAAGTN